MAGLEQGFIDEVRAKSDIVEVVAEYVRLERRGGRLWGLCPFHAEKTPSFSVVPGEQFYYCFGCQAAGDVIKFVQQRENLSFYEAVVHLARRARVAVPEQEQSPAEKQRQSERQQIEAALDLAARYFQHQLLHAETGRDALAYLQERGLSTETLQRFRLGYAPGGWDNLVRALKRRAPEEVLARAGLVQPRRSGQGYIDRFRGRVMFPIADIRGRVVGFGGRVLAAAGDEPKYLNSPESPFFSKRRYLYALHLARESIREQGEVVVVEGYLDAIACHQAGLANVVASLGTALTHEQARLLLRQTETVTIAFDADAAGQRATLKGLDVLAAVGCDVRVLSLPPGQDPDDLIRSAGSAAWRQAVAEARPLIEFKLRLAMEQAGVAHLGVQAGPEAKAKLFERDIVPLFQVLADLSRRDVNRTVQYLGWLAEQVGLPEEVVRYEFRRFMQAGERGGRQNKSAAIRDNKRDFNTKQDLAAGSAKQSPRRQETGPDGEKEVATKKPRPTPTDRHQAAIFRAERSLLALLIHNPAYWPKVRSELGDASFEMPLYRVIAEAIAGLVAETAATAEGFSGRLLSRLGDAEVAAEAAGLLSSPPPIERAEQMLAQCIATIHQHRLLRRLDHVQMRMSEQEAAGQPVDRALLLEYLELKQTAGQNRN